MAYTFYSSEEFDTPMVEIKYDDEIFFSFSIHGLAFEHAKWLAEVLDYELRGIVHRVRKRERKVLREKIKGLKELLQ